MIEPVILCSFLACMVGVGMSVLWVAGRLPCRVCNLRERDRKRSIMRRIEEAMENPKPRSELLPIEEWMDQVCRLNGPPWTHSCENQGCGSKSCESCGPYEARKTAEYLNKYQQLTSKGQTK